MSKKKILCISQDQELLNELYRDLREDYEVTLAHDFLETQNALVHSDISLVICDNDISSEKSLDLLTWIQNHYPSTMRILLASGIETNTITSAIENNIIHKFVFRPWHRSILLLYVLETLSLQKLLIERDKFRELSLTDPVTDLTNHRFFQEKFRLEVSKAKKMKTSLSLIMLDVDHFKILNDQFGHPRGDQILSVIAQKLTSVLPANYFISRYGGEEFAVIMPKTTSQLAFQLAEKMRHTVADMRDFPFRLSISLGISTYPEHGLDADELIAVADQALYCAKRQGRNMTIVGFESSV